MASNNDTVNFLVISKTLGFSDREIQNLLKSCFSVLVTAEQIESLYRANEHKYINYKKDVRANKKSIPRRIIRFAKKNSINLGLDQTTPANYKTDVVSFAVSLILKNLSINVKDLSNYLKVEFPNTEIEKLDELIRYLRVEGYRFDGYEFSRVLDLERHAIASQVFVEGLGEIKIIRSDKTYFDRRRKLLVLKENVNPTEFLIRLLDRQNDFFSEEVQRCINKVDSIL